MEGACGGITGAWYATQRFADASDLAQALGHAGVEYVPLEAGRYDSQLTVIGSQSLTMQRAVDRAHVVRARTDPRAVTLLLPLRHQRAPTINGWETDGADGLLLGPGSEVHGLCPGEVDWASLILPTEAVGALAGSTALADGATRSGAMLRLPPRVIRPLQRAVVAAADMMAAHAASADAPTLAGAIAASLVDDLSAGLLLSEPFTAPRATREAIRLVGTAVALLDAHPDRPLLTTGLCAALGVSPRALHKAFVAAAGMSPQAFLRRRRLIQVHGALKAGGGAAGLVKSVALGHGFWHLGHFARSYQEMFGQTPSETLAAALGAGRGRRLAAA